MPFFGRVMDGGYPDGQKTGTVGLLLFAKHFIHFHGLHDAALSPHFLHLNHIDVSLLKHTQI